MHENRERTIIFVFCHPSEIFMDARVACVPPMLLESKVRVRNGGKEDKDGERYLR